MIPATTLPSPVTAPPPVQPQIFSQLTSEAAVLGRLPAVAVGAGVQLSETFNRTKKPAPDNDEGFRVQLTQDQLSQYSEIKYKPSNASRPPDPKPAFHFVPPPPLDSSVVVPIAVGGQEALPILPATQVAPETLPADAPAEVASAPKSLLIFPNPGADAYRTTTIRNSLNLALSSPSTVDVIL